MYSARARRAPQWRRTCSQRRRPNPLLWSELPCVWRGVRMVAPPVGDPVWWLHRAPLATPKSVASVAKISQSATFGAMARAFAATAALSRCRCWLRRAKACMGRWHVNVCTAWRKKAGQASHPRGSKCALEVKSKCRLLLALAVYTIPLRTTDHRHSQIQGFPETRVSHSPVFILN
eukprot:COSAG06_NODE_4324_length_4366_cov_3.080853_4_plen_176_part_00